MKNLINQIDKEILWDRISKERINKLKKDIAGNYRAGIYFKDFNLKINITYDKKEYEEYLLEKFELAPPYQGEPEVYFTLKDDLTQVDMPSRHYGMVCDSEEVIEAIVVTSSYGVIKSTISGFATFLVSSQGFTPAHAAVVRLGNKSILLAGPSGAGKTTTLLHLGDYAFSRKINYSVQTDDWCVLRKNKNGKLESKTFDPSISMKPKTLESTGKLFFYQKNHISRMLSTRKKVSFSPKVLFGENSLLEITEIDMIIALLPTAGKEKLTKIDGKLFGEYMVSSAYHAPYLDKKQISKDLFFWEMVHSNFPTYGFATRPIIGETQSLDCLFKKILKYD